MTFGSLHKNRTFEGGIFPAFVGARHTYYIGDVTIRGAYGEFISFHAGSKIV